MSTRLYPEYSLEQLELMYHDQAAALWAAAEEKHGNKPATCVKQCEEWLIKGQPAAEKAARILLEHQAKNRKPNTPVVEH